MSEKYLLRLDTKKVTRKSVKVVKAKRHKLQWCACARPREGRGLQHFLRGLSGILATLSMRGDFLGKVLQWNAPCRLLNRPRLWNKSPLFRKKNSHVFWKISIVFEKISHVFEKISIIFSVLSYVLNYTSSEGEREIMNLWGFRFDVLKRGSILWLTSSELVRLQRRSIALGAQKKSHSSQDEWDFYCSAQCWLPHQGRN